MRQAKLIGTWRYEDEDGVEEISFRPDHTFWQLETSKKEFITPSPLEETGSWQLKGDQLLLDSVVTWNKQQNQFSRTVVSVGGTALVIKTVDGSKSLLYKRLAEVACDPSSDPSSALSEATLLGSWQTHYNTHDYQYRFSRDGRVDLFYLFPDGLWQPLLAGEWHIENGKLFIQFQKDASGPIQEKEDIWTPIAIRANCIAMRGNSSRPCIMRRVHLTNR